MSSLTKILLLVLSFSKIAGYFGILVENVNKELAELSFFIPQDAMGLHTTLRFTLSILTHWKKAL